MAKLGAAIVTGVGVGLVAGVPQVVLTQAEARLLGMPDEHADIGPRFVQRVSEDLGERPSGPVRWALAAAFHFGYAACWGALYAVVQAWRPSQPHVGGPLLGALIYALAFSPWGAATQTDTERPPHARTLRETMLHWTAALSFGLVTAYLYDWLRRPAGAPEALEPLPSEAG